MIEEHAPAPHRLGVEGVLDIDDQTAAGTQRTVDEAEAALRTAEARVASAQTRLSRRRVFSPVTGTVQQIYYRPGEVVPAGRPVVSLLPPGNIKVRFFVPEPVLGSLRIGQAVQATCDGCGAPVRAAIRYISRQAEYTPPVLYSREQRARRLATRRVGQCRRVWI